MSSIIKSSFVSYSDQKKKIEVIESHDEKILRNPLEQKLFNHSNIEDKLLDDDEFNEEDEAFKEVETLTPLQILDNAHNEALKIIELAKEEAEGIKGKIRDSANIEGYEEGFNKGREVLMMEVEQLKQQLKLEIEVVKVHKESLIKEIEPKMVEIIMHLVISLVGKQSLYQDTILFVIKKGLEEVELKGDIIIKISPEDYEYVIENRKEIESIFSNKIDVEIFKDVQLEQNDCIIETSLGNIDCGLSGRLNGLINELKLIGESIE